jgi:hypothetical protein
MKKDLQKDVILRFPSVNALFDFYLFINSTPECTTHGVNPSNYTIYCRCPDDWILKAIKDLGAVLSSSLYTNAQYGRVG